MNLSAAKTFAVTLACILFIGITPARSADDPAAIRHQIDSLKRAMPEVKKEHRRFTCTKIIALYNALGETDELREFINESISEARNTGDTVMEGTLIVRRVAFFGNHGMADSLRRVIDRDLDFLARTRQWDFRFFCHNSWVNILMFNGNMDEALAEANKMYRFAKEHSQNNGIGLALSAIGIVSHGMTKLDEAADAYREALGYFEGDNRHGFILNTTRDLCMVLFEQERYEEAVQRCADAEKVLEEGMKMPGKLDFTSQQFNLYNQFATAYLGLGRPEPAEKYLALMKKSPWAALSKGQRTINNVEWKIYKAKGDFPRALEAIERHYRNQLAEGAEMDAHYTLTNLAQVAKKAGDYRRASDAFELMVVQNDSIRSLENLTALDDLRTQYEVDKLEAQKQARENYLWLAAGIIALLVALLLIWMRYTKKVHDKNRGLVRRLEEQDRLAAELESREEELRKLRLLQPQDQPAAPKEAHADLYEKLRELMKDPTVYTDPSLSRRSLAEMLGTNEKYLHEVIRTHYGATFTEYINALRLNYARQLLVGSAEKYTVETVAIICGIDSRNTFHRLFREHYGLTPDEFRRNSASS